MLKNKEFQIILLSYILISVIAAGICVMINFWAGFVCLGGFLLAGASFYQFTLYRYKKIRELSDYMNKISDGKAFIDIRDNREGELSILKNDVYKLSSRLWEQSRLLREDKLWMKEILQNISHQCKTPLTSLSIMADLLENENLPPEKRREFINNIHKSLNHMEWLVLNLLKMARLDADAAPFKRETIQVRELLETSLEPLVVLAERSEKSFAIQPQSDEEMELTCDLQWTSEALTNILKNAMEYSPRHSLITVRYGENLASKWISVSNTGCEISKEDFPHLFKRFYKGKNSSKDSIGIGLAMSLSIMQKQNGDIEAMSSTREGTTFTLKFYKSVL